MDYEDPPALGGVDGPGLSAMHNGHSASAGSGVISVGRKKYAVNLYWQPAPSGRVSQDAREAANQPGQMADFYAARPGNTRGRVPQFGLGQKEYGHKVGMPTGAASLADDQPGSWGGVFKVPEGWWMVISRDDLIAPDGDILFGEEEEARTRLFEEINLGGLQRIYAPGHWNVAGSDPVEVSLLMQGRSDFRLQFVRYPVKAILFGLLALAAVGVLIYYALQWQAQREKDFEDGLGNLTSEQRAIARLEQQQRLMMPPPPPPPPKKVWQDQPTAISFLEACHKALATIPAYTPGWQRQDISCTPDSITVTWLRVRGRAALPDKATVSKLDGATVSVYPMEHLAPRGEEALGGNGDIVTLALTGDWPVTLEDMPDDQIQVGSQPQGMPVPGAIAAPPKPVMGPAPWIKKKITLKGETAPWNGWSRYASLPGFVLNKVTWRDKSWVTEGTLYENR